jgi:hypothetical protein
MSNIKNSFPAFPVADHDPQARRLLTGMSLRDYFAAKAMQSLLAHAVTQENDSASGVTASVSVAAYMVADAMLRARENAE